MQGLKRLSPKSFLVMVEVEEDKMAVEGRMDIEEKEDEQESEEIKVFNVFYPTQLVGLHHANYTAQINFMVIDLVRENMVSF